MNQRMARQRLAKRRKLGLVGQLAVDQQVRGLDERGFFRQLFDGITTVAQNTALTVDKSDGALARARVAITRIECDVSGFLAKFRNVDSLLAFAAHDDWQFVRFAFEFKFCLVAHGHTSYVDAKNGFNDTILQKPRA